MKYLNISIVLIILSGTISYAFMVTQGSPIICFEKATSKSGYDMFEEIALQLCSGTKSPMAPIDCLNSPEYPEDLFLTDEDLIDLCSGAEVSDTPVKCLIEVYNNDVLELTKEEATYLCRKASSPTAPIICFYHAHIDEGGPMLDLDAALFLCSGS